MRNFPRVTGLLVAAEHPIRLAGYLPFVGKINRGAGFPSPLLSHEGAVQHTKGWPQKFHD